jgi:hypothetical protein
MHIRIAKAGLSVTEVPSFEYPRLHGVSNLNTFGDGIRILRTILTERRQSKRKPTSGSSVETAPLGGTAASQSLHANSMASAASYELD